MSEDAFLSGNEALARGLWEAGIAFAAGYPGTPSTEILESLGGFEEVEARWCANEKVAFDQAVGANMGGLRVAAAMKHVGLNVASDSFQVLGYAGVDAAFVLVSADDPGMHSSQNEQDNRWLARMARVPVLEPSDAQDCRDFVLLAVHLSERWKLPVMIRTTTRVAHTRAPVRVGPRGAVPRLPYQPDPRRRVVPIFRHGRREDLEARWQQVRREADTLAPARLLPRPEAQRANGHGPAARPGVIAAGVAVQYAEELMPEADVLQLVLTHPLPLGAVTAFAREHPELYVLEEGDGVIEAELREAGVRHARGKKIFPTLGELTPGAIRRALTGQAGPQPLSQAQLPRPPRLCAGCPHLGSFSVLSRMRGLHVVGDIGCYTMGALPPFGVMESVHCMGSSIGQAIGLSRVLQQTVMAVIGDSTFIHAGLPALADAVYQRARVAVLILDNGTTGMTGQQPHPASGQGLRGDPAPALDLEAVCRGFGVPVETVEAWDQKAIRRALRQALVRKGPSVILARGLCQLLPEQVQGRPGPLQVLLEKCTRCDLCLQVGCAAVADAGEGWPAIDPAACTGCALCAHWCPTGAIVPLAAEA